MESSREIDVLEHDSPLTGQKYACISFISPDKILKKKELFFYSEFLKKLELKQDVERFRSFIHFIAHKYNHSTSDLFKDFDEFLNSEKKELVRLDVEEEYKSFLDANEDTLTEVFSKENDFQTNVRGLKIRGSFETQREAENRCKSLRKLDPNHDIFVGPVGVWMPWDPDAYRTGKVEYLEKELNTLMHEKLENEEKAKQHFEHRVREQKKDAINENKKKAKLHDIKLTQNVDKDGNLYRTNKRIEDNSTPRTKEYEKQRKREMASSSSTSTSSETASLLSQLEEAVERKYYADETT